MTDYYVSESGSDSNFGTFTQPFRSIQHAANQMVNGDSCIIRQGIYRETVIPICDNVSFYPYNEEKVVINGADIINSWTNHEGDIYKATMNWNMGKGKNQLFVNGEMVYVSHWPNGITDPSHPIFERVKSGSWENISGETAGYGIINADLPQNKNLVGTTVTLAPGVEWFMITGQVTNYSSTQIQFDFDWLDNWYARTWYPPKEGNPFYLSDSMELLDTSGMWYFDYDTNILYLWTSDSSNPEMNVVETKRREIGFDISGRSNIVIDALEFFACRLNSDEFTTNCLIQNITAKYVSHYSIVTENAVEMASRDTGFFVLGNDNQLLNSKVSYSAGNVVYLGGTNNIVDGCIIHDGGYAGSDCAPLYTEWYSSNNDITNNVIYNSARSVLTHRFSSNIKIMYNDIYNAGLQLKDLGITYAFVSDGAGTEIAYNLVHDNLSSHYGFGIYLDNGCSNYNVHHNIVYNAERAMQLGKPSLNNKIFNNTLSATDKGLDSHGTAPNMENTEIRNNIFDKSISRVSYATLSNNILEGTDPLFVDPDNHDYHLQAGSPAIDAGIDVGLTKDYDDVIIPVGLVPDIGAYEYTEENLEECTGVCCPEGKVCRGGSFVNSLDCGSRCCIGGICSDPPIVVPQNEMSIIYVDSEEMVATQKPATNILDGNNNTIWHTEWQNSQHPHEVQIDLGQTYDLISFEYTPRQDNNENGMIKDFQFYVSNDVNNWGSPVALGTFTSSTDTQKVIFDEKQGRYVRLVALSEINGEIWTTAAELNVLGYSKVVVDPCEGVEPNWTCELDNENKNTGWKTDLNNCHDKEYDIVMCPLEVVDPCEGVEPNWTCELDNENKNTGWKTDLNNCHDKEYDIVMCPLEVVDPCEGVEPNWTCEYDTDYRNTGWKTDLNNCFSREYDIVMCPIGVVNPCDGVECPDYCDGTTKYYGGICAGGKCYYHTEVNSIACGYIPPDDASNATELLTKIVLGIGLLKLLIK